MLDTLRAWLNGSREYYTGVVLYEKLGRSTALLQLFQKGKSAYTEKRLQEELTHICNSLKHEKPQTAPLKDHRVAAAPEHLVCKLAKAADTAPPNADLLQLCKLQADKTYKEVMNLRAELFAMARPDDYTDPNTPDKIQQREKLAVTVVSKYIEASKLYDRVDYVRQHGRLPTDSNEDDDGEDYTSLPDHLVKQTLDNLRKNYNKMKKREATPERLALLQKHESNIQKLQARWLLLKPTL